jgi:hypothetical protein
MCLKTAEKLNIIIRSRKRTACQQKKTWKDYPRNRIINGGNILIRTWKIAALLGASCLLLLSPSAKAQEDASAIEQKPESSVWDKFHNDFRVTLQYISEDDTDLGATNAGTEDSFSQQLQMMTGVDLTEDWYGFFHGRALNINGESGF